ncbi:hypothetical protein ACROYT_G016118 [Oculina patagonica]
MKSASVMDWVVLPCDHIVCIYCVAKSEKKLKNMKECGCGEKFESDISMYQYITTANCGFMNRGNRSRQDSKAKKDQKQKQDESGKTDESSDTSCKDITKEVFHSKTEEIVSATEKMSQQSKHVSENATASTSNATNTENNQISPSRKRPAALANELIAYVESIGDRKRNRKDTTNYSPVVFQVEDSNKRRAICFSETKRQLLVEITGTHTCMHRR